MATSRISQFDENGRFLGYEYMDTNSGEEMGFIESDDVNPYTGTPLVEEPSPAYKEPESPDDFLPGSSITIAQAQAMQANAEIILAHPEYYAPADLAAAAEQLAAVDQAIVFAEQVLADQAVRQETIDVEEPPPAEGPNALVLAGLYFIGRRVLGF